MRQVQRHLAQGSKRGRQMDFHILQSQIIIDQDAKAKISQTGAHDHYKCSLILCEYTIISLVLFYITNVYYHIC